MKGAGRAACAALVLSLGPPGGAAADSRAPLAPPAGQPAVLEGERRSRQEMLRTLEERARASQEARQRLEREIATLKTDREKLSAALVATARDARGAEERVRAVESRLDSLLAREAALRQSLADRRAVTAEVLAALQRMGRAPLPALIAKAEDVVQALRAAALLGAVVPTLREEARILAADLAELVRLREAIAADRRALEAEYLALAGERDRLGALIQARQERLATAEADFGRERFRADEIGAEVRTLRQLLGRLDAEAARAQRDAELARSRAEAEAAQARERLAAAALREPVPLSPRQPFARAKGTLIVPVVGEVLREFGAPDGSGGSLRGSVIKTRPRALVTAPADGTIVFAGPFRSYGRLLIMNVGGGYYLLLAGMVSVHVEVGQFVLGGEPVGAMGEVAAPAASLGVVETDGPVLYVELRKDGGSIDPGPWWAKTQGERARG